MHAEQSMHRLQCLQAMRSTLFDLSSSGRIVILTASLTSLLLFIVTYTHPDIASWPSRYFGQTTPPQSSSASPNASSPTSPSHLSSSSGAWEIPLNLPRSEPWRRQCAVITGESLGEFARSLGSAPFFAHFHNGEPLRPAAEQNHIVGDEFCSVVIVPQPGRNESAEVESRPISGWGPDAMHASMKSDDIWLILESPVYWGSLSLENRGHAGEANSSSSSPPSSPFVAAIYMTAYALNHPGSYQADGAIEFQNYDWVMEDSVDVYNVYLTMDQATYLPYYVQNITIRSDSPPIVIGGHPVSRPTRKCYHDGNNDLHGRWYRASSFGPSGNQTVLNPAAMLEYAIHNNTVDPWGYTFAPDSCSMPYFTVDDYHSCLGDRSVVVHGDSNSRRLLKTIMAAGTGAWCPDINAGDSWLCECQDTWEHTIYDSVGREINSTHYFVDFQEDEPIIFGNNTKAYYDMVGGMVRPFFGHPWQRWFTRSDYAADSITDRRLQENGGSIDLVHLSFIGWDVGYASRPEWADPETGLPALRRALKAAYPSGTKFIHRLANAPCCGNFQRRLRYDIPRFALWNNAWRNFFRDEEQREEIRVVDVGVLQGREDAEMYNGGCPMTHLRASHVRLEGMMWMSAICDKNEDEGGAAKWRAGWGFR